MTDADDTKMPRRELLMLLVLMLVQFAGILDMILVAPLELPLTRAFGRSAAWFAQAILAFTASSCVVSVVGSPLLDRYDRKPALLALYGGFGLGALACALAPSATWFVAARVFMGAFAGIMSAAASAVVGDAVPPARRGTASGVVNAAYALAFIVGVPLGVYLAQHYSWRAPFYLMAAQTVAVAALGAAFVPSLRGHLGARGGVSGAAGGAPAAAASPSLRELLADATHLRALALNGLLMFSAYAVTPFLATYIVANLGFAERTIPLFYLVGGVFTLAAGVGFGAWADRVGNAKAFAAISAAAVLPTLWVTQMETRSLAVALVATTLFMAFATGRTVPALALALDAVDAPRRGAFMSLVAAVQQISLGLGAVAAGSIVVEGPGHALGRFGWCGALSAAAGLASVYLALRAREHTGSVASGRTAPRSAG